LIRKGITFGKPMQPSKREYYENKMRITWKSGKEYLGDFTQRDENDPNSNVPVPNGYGKLVTPLPDNGSATYNGPFVDG